MNFNREVLGSTGLFFGSSTELAELLAKAEADADSARSRGAAARDRAAASYRWDDVADGYEALCLRLMDRMGASAPTATSTAG